MADSITAKWRRRCSNSFVRASSLWNNQLLQSVTEAHRHSDWAGDSKQASITGVVIHHTNSGGGVAFSGWQRAMALAENKNLF